MEKVKINLHENFPDDREIKCRCHTSSNTFKKLHHGNNADTSECSLCSRENALCWQEENRIGFLNQCKLELSAEVIRWKEESLKLHKDKEADQIKIKELQTMVNKLTKKNSDLDAKLVASVRENQRLKMHTLAVDEENSFLHKKLSKTYTKFHSFPWSDSLQKYQTTTVYPFLNENVTISSNSKQIASESWEEVSQKLLAQMKREMIELEELGQKLVMDDPSTGSTVFIAASNSENMDKPRNELYEKEAEDSISDMKYDMECLQHHLKSQNEALKFMLMQISGGSGNFLRLSDGMLCEDSERNKSNISVRKAHSEPGILNECGTDNNAEKRFIRPSDESFRAYFRQQLNSSKSSTEDMSKLVSEETDPIENANCLKRNSANNTEDGTMFHTGSDSNFLKNVASSRLSTKQVTVLNEHCENLQFESSKQSSANHTPEEERVCPICEAVFPKVISQKEFETHVVAHLEVESESLLDQYDVI